ncbi:putative transcriptional regulator of viral defense system [Acetoanaerobium pronyense]|uniref:Transcriptional regulator of viral defense system n=1 Tax=Acetoanaerobium pronyense TaxID=1482736 RepID=A0ABS4KI71_9FIRM|nr:type IV toxin-antitoxin system AbiEi family antitoxin domain-containing protein [Acetoanaerobium pronyense]MBP2027455.1 putative transcriptional regulator of viral defense system [Acetoanaerobium pronyense]
MSKNDLVLKLLKKNNGFITSLEAKSKGIDNKILQRMEKLGQLERVEHGLYMDSNQMEDEYYLSQYRCKKGIFSHETALYFHELADRTPFQIMITIPSGYNTRLLKEKNKYKFFYVAKNLHTIGKITMKTPYGNEVYVYDKERTICDCLKKKEQLDRDLINEAVRRYLKTPGSDYAKLIKYAGLFNMKELIRQYMEVLI